MHGDKKIGGIVHVLQMQWLDSQLLKNFNQEKLSKIPFQCFCDNPSEPMTHAHPVINSIIGIILYL